MSKVYIMGSLRNPTIPVVANAIEAAGHKVFADWFSPGPEADEYWRSFEELRGRSYLEAINGPHACHVFNFDKHWLDWCEVAVLALPAGSSAHLELGYVLGKGKRGYILLLEDHSRWDVMYRFADGIFDNLTDLVERLR